MCQSASLELTTCMSQERERDEIMSSSIQRGISINGEPMKPNSKIVRKQCSILEQIKWIIYSRRACIWIRTRLLTSLRVFVRCQKKSSALQIILVSSRSVSQQKWQNSIWNALEWCGRGYGDQSRIISQWSGRTPIWKQPNWLQTHCDNWLISSY